MKCAICGRKTNWNESYGYENFIVCPCCFNFIKEETKKESWEVLELIFILGKAKKNQKKR